MGDKSREAFEAWWSSPAMTLVRAATTQYQSLTKSWALAAWQASRKQAMDEVAALFPHDSAEYFGSTIQEEIEALK